MRCVDANHKKSTCSCETNEAYRCQTETDNDQKKKVQQSKYVEMLTSGQMDNTLTKKKRKTDRLRRFTRRQRKIGDRISPCISIPAS